MVYNEDKVPYQTIMVYRDVEEQREQAAVFQKWRQSLDARALDSYTLFRSNLSKGTTFDKLEGRLLPLRRFEAGLGTFNQRAVDFARHYVHPDDIKAYTTLMNSQNRLNAFQNGMRTACLDFRDRIETGEYHWLHLTVEMAQYPDAEEVEAFLMYEPSQKIDHCAER